MRIIFVRHGHPDYRKDCLTELGHLHAEAAAERLAGEDIRAIYSSSCGRAAETAQHIAARFSLPVTQLDFMRELSWGSDDGTELISNGHPWYTADDMAARGQTLMDPDWAEKEPFLHNRVCASAAKAAAGFDQWLVPLGLRREGLYYRVLRKNSDTVVMTSHGGSSTAVLAHLLNLPFPFLCASVCPDFTAITILRFAMSEEGKLITPKVEILNDARHIGSVALPAAFDR